jgi:DNA-binding NarL/FixJ family response regulator
MESNVRVPTLARPAATKRRAKSYRATIVVVDSRVLWRDCLVKCLTMEMQSFIVLAFTRLADWKEVEKNYAPAAVILLCSHSNDSADMDIDCDLPFVSHAGIVVPVIIVSENEDADHILAIWESGARGYIPTSLTLNAAVGAMQFVAAGGTFVPATTLMFFKHLKAAPGSRTLQKRSLTNREAAVLACLRRGKANKQIAHELDMSEGTVKVHIRNLMKKLKVHNRTEAAVLASSLQRSPR